MIIERTDAVARVMLDFLARHRLGRG
jgi:hypothetical protein